MKELISVIVPIYKVEQYLERCIESLINQTYKNLEIILVDDGSPDNCGKICDEYAKKDARIKVIHKENGGLSDARNSGLKVATGEFVSFIDSDDWISLDAYEKMLKAAIEQDADIVECNVNYDYDGKIEPYNTDEYAVYTDKDSIMEAYIRYYRIKTVAWNKLYKKSILQGVEFKYGKYNEDEFFTYQVLAKINRLVHISDYCYYYYQRNNSIMGAYNLKRLDAFEAFSDRLQFLKENYPSLYEKEKITFCCLCIFHYQMLLKNKSIDKDKKGRLSVSCYRKKIILKNDDVKKSDIINRVSLLLSNSSVGLDFVSKVRNLFNYGL